MEVQSYICQLPEEILCYIASFLSPKDVTRLSMTCCQMRRILPTFIVIHGPGINQIGPSDGHWTPEFYFNAPKLTSRLKTVTISMSWHDQGHGNRKGLIWTQLIRPNLTKVDWPGCSKEEIISEDLDIFDLAPHHEKRVLKVLSVQEGVLKNALPGDYIRFMKNVGGGGGHRLVVKDFKVIIEMFPSDRDFINFSSNNHKAERTSTGKAIETEEKFEAKFREGHKDRSPPEEDYLHGYGYDSLIGRHNRRRL